MTSSVEIGVNSRNEASAWHGVNDGGGALLVVERTLATLSVKKSSTPMERLADTRPRPRRLSTDRKEYKKISACVRSFECFTALNICPPEVLCGA